MDGDQPRIIMGVPSVRQFRAMPEPRQQPAPACGSGRTPLLRQRGDVGDPAAAGFTVELNLEIERGCFGGGLRVH